MQKQKATMDKPPQTQQTQQTQQQTAISLTEGKKLPNAIFLA
jgi:hypothetical protein